METVLVTGARAPISLDLARSFKNNSYKVILADSIHFPVSRWSNVVWDYIKLPSPKYKVTEFIQCLKEIIELYDVKHLIPTSEEAFYIALYKKEFNCKVWVTDIEKMDLLHNKNHYPKFVKAHLSVPETIVLCDFNDWENSNTYVFKPIYSRFASSTIVKKKVSKSYFDEIDKSKWIVQKYIVGKEFCVYSIWDDGILKAYSTYHPLYRVGNGAGVYFENTEHQKTYNLIKKLGKEINYTGQLCFDVIIDVESNPHFIECNPRGTSGAHLIGDELSKAFVGDDLVYGKTNKDYSVKSVLFFTKPKKFFTAKVKSSKDVIYHKKDRKPYFFQWLSILEITYVKFRRKISWLDATTEDIEWNGYEG